LHQSRRQADYPGVAQLTNIPLNAKLAAALAEKAKVESDLVKSLANSSANDEFYAKLRTQWDEALLNPERAIFSSIQRLGTADTKNIQQIAASQIELLNAYYQLALAQSTRSFFWALIGSGLGLLLFAVAVVFSLLNGLGLASIVPLISGAVVEVVSSLVFYLYGKTSSQLSAFRPRLEVLQRYLLANSICESLDGEERNRVRAALIQEISRTQPQT
jgi:hypothetical protein